jgi:hypothetical protein
MASDFSYFQEGSHLSNMKFSVLKVYAFCGIQYSTKFSATEFYLPLACGHHVHRRGQGSNTGRGGCKLGVTLEPTTA